MSTNHCIQSITYNNGQNTYTFNHGISLTFKDETTTLKNHDSVHYSHNYNMHLDGPIRRSSPLPTTTCNPGTSSINISPVWVFEKKYATTTHCR